MSKTLQEMTQDMQARISELAYLMWESAGRQQGMAMEYWLKAESEVLSTLHAAASQLMPSDKTAKAPASAPVAAAAQAALADASAAAAAPAPEAKPAPEATPEPVATTAARKPAARKAKA